MFGRTREKGAHWVTAQEKPVMVMKNVALPTLDMKLSGRQPISLTFQ
jgi:hypothetical protein